MSLCCAIRGHCVSYRFTETPFVSLTARDVCGIVRGVVLAELKGLSLLAPSTISGSLYFCYRSGSSPAALVKENLTTSPDPPFSSSAEDGPKCCYSIFGLSSKVATHVVQLQVPHCDQVTMVTHLLPHIDGPCDSSMM